MGGIVREQSVSMFQKLKENDATCYECLPCKSCCHVLNMPFKDRKANFLLFGGNGTFCFVKPPFSKSQIGVTQNSSSFFVLNFSSSSKFLHMSSPLRDKRGTP